MLPQVCMHYHVNLQLKQVLHVPGYLLHTPEFSDVSDTGSPISVFTFASHIHLQFMPQVSYICFPKTYSDRGVHWYNKCGFFLPSLVELFSSSSCIEEGEASVIAPDGKTLSVAGDNRGETGGDDSLAKALAQAPHVALCVRSPKCGLAPPRLWSSFLYAVCVYTHIHIYIYISMSSM